MAPMRAGRSSSTGSKPLQALSTRQVFLLSRIGTGIVPGGRDAARAGGEGPARPRRSTDAYQAVPVEVLDEASDTFELS
jgi:hypothetical protein